jgi:dTDP-glucose 4,6-dehydratase/UDP-glucose 4-epimerase
MQVHVTGGCGFVGSRLVRHLVDAGHDVTVFDNVSRGAVEKLGPAADAVDLIQGDVREYDELADAVDDPDVLYHLAAINGTKNFYERPLSVLDVNVRGTQNVVDLMADRDIPRLVFTSSSEAYGFPREFPTPETHPLQVMDAENDRFSYAGSKVVGEQYVVQGARQHDFE